MGCKVSKVDDLPLVIRCRERKRLIKSAVDYRYELSCSHLVYFNGLKDVGYVLSRFVDEQLVIPSPSNSPSVASPVLTLPSDDLGKSNKNNGSVGSGSDSGSVSRLHSINDGGDKDDESELSVSLDGHAHLHNENDDVNYNDNEMNVNEPYVSNRGPVPYEGPNPPYWGDYYYEMNRGYQPYQPQWGEPYVENPNPSAFSYQPPWGPSQTSWGESGDPSASQYQPTWGPYQGDFGSYNGYNGNSNPDSNPNRYAFYMKKSAPASHTVIQPEEARGFRETSQWVDPDPPGYDPYGSGYGYGFSYGGEASSSQEPVKPKSPPPPPPPMESDYFNFFDAYDNEYHGYGYGYGYETADSSPDTSEVREKEGIPDLEEETETESHNEEVVKTFSRKRNLGDGKENNESSSWKETSSSNEGSSRRMSPGKSEDTTKAEHVESTSNPEPFQNKGAHSVNNEVDKHSSETIVSHSTEDHEDKKEVGVDIDEGSTHELKSSDLSSLTTLSPHGSRDLHEVVNEIKDEFESAFSHGREVAMMLEAGKLPYRSKFAVLKVIFSKIIYPLAPSLASSDHSIQSVRSTSQVTKLAGSYIDGAVLDVRPINLSSTLEKLYVWEKKLYKEVKVVTLVLG